MFSLLAQVLRVFRALARLAHYLLSQFSSDRSCCAESDLVSKHGFQLTKHQC